MKYANGPGDASRVTIAEPNRGCVVAPPLDPLPIWGGDGCCFFCENGIGNGRAMPLVSRSPNNIVRRCRCVRLRCGRRMHRPYGGPVSCFFATPMLGQ